jgi:hypothetical protein
MKIKSLFTPILIIASTIVYAQAPNFQWTERIGGTNNDQALSTAVDALGNVYITGAFSGTVDFDPGPGAFTLISSANFDIYVCKLTASGSFVWAIKMGGIGNDISRSIALDDSANVYTTGSFGGTVDFDPGVGTMNLISFGNNDIFISKLDSAGNFVWGKQLGGINADNGNSIATDGEGNVYTTGSYQGTADFDPSVDTFNITTAGFNDVFVSKLNSAGEFVWAKSFGGISIDIGYGIAVEKSADADVLITGSFMDTADFDPGAGTFNLAAVQGTDIFISKLDSAGNFIWAKAISGTSAEAGFAIAVDTTGNVYATGFFLSTTDFDPDTTTFTLTSNGNGDIFLLKLDSTGHFAWAKSMGSADYDYGYAIALDSMANVFVTGTFLGTVDFDPGTGTFNQTSAGGIDVFIVSLDSSGNFLWTLSAGGIQDDEGHGIALNPLGNVYVAGHFNSAVITFGTTVLVNADNVNFTTDIFITKLDVTTGIESVENAEDFLIYPNPASSLLSLSINLLKADDFSFSIYTASGSKVKETTIGNLHAGANHLTISLDALPTGIYICEIKSDMAIKRTKLLVE